MPINCPKCDHAIDLSGQPADSLVRCPECGALFKPPAGAVEPAPAVPEAPDVAPSILAGIDEASNASTELAPAATGASAVGVEQRSGRRRGMRLVMVGLPILAALAALGIYARVRMDRRAYAESVAARLAEAEGVYRGGDMERCEGLVAEVAGMVRARPEAVPAELAARVKQRSSELLGHVGLWREAAGLMKSVEADPAATRRKLGMIHGEAAARGADAEPVAKLVAGMCQAAYEAEFAARSAEAGKLLAGLSAGLDKGDFEAARAGLKAVRERCAAAPGDMAGRLAESFRARFEALDAAFRARDEIAKLVAAAPPAGPKRAAVEEAILNRRNELAGELAGPAARGFALLFDKWVAELRADRRELPAAAKLGRAELQALAADFAAALPGLALAEPGIDEATGIIRLSGAGHSWRTMLCELDGQPTFLIEVDGVRLAYPSPRAPKGEVKPEKAEALAGLRRAMIRAEMNQAAILGATLARSGREEAWVEDPWRPLIAGNVQGAEPLAELPAQGLLCTAGRVWKVEPEGAGQELRGAAQGFVAATQALEKALAADSASDKELRELLGMMVSGAYRQRKSASDFLPRQFCSEAINSGYIEANAPELAARLGAKLPAYRQAYAGLIAFRTVLAGKTGAGDEIGLAVNADGRALWRIYDAASGTTTFALRHNDTDFPNLFFVHTVFAGRHESWPAAEPPRAVRMVHSMVGEVASWDAAADKLAFDAARWRLAAEVDELVRPPAHYGAPDWRFPPHVLLVDATGRAMGLVTPGGRLDMPEFGRRTGEARRAAQDAFIDRCAKCLRSPGELHLFFRYFTKYTYDSPLTAYPLLIGDKSHNGDVHQNAYQTLDRKVAGRFIADCDDLAEFYQEVTRRQGRLSFVLGQPSHAICGFVEREGGDYVFTSVDTGLPRQFRAARLEDALEAGYATYDEERSEVFNPNTLCFLLRFAGEPTRTPYYLGARMFVDAKYAETMIRVQRDWHFAYIASGRATMEEMVKREKDSPTLFELAGFYRELGDWPNALNWARKAIAAMPPDDIMGRLGERLHLAAYLDRSGDREAAVRSFLEDAAELAAAETAAGGEGAERFIGMRMRLAEALDAMDRPWEAWKVAAPAARKLAAAGELGGENVTGLAGILLSMRDEEDRGARPAGDDGAAAKELGALLAKALGAGCFKESDTLGDVMGKYADLALLQAATHGRAYALEHLLAPGPYPSGPRAHHRRTGAAAAEAEDWKWIRVSVPAYARFFHDALDARKPVAERRPDEAVRILAALERALPEIEKQGSLSNMEFALLSMRVQRDAITKNWAGMEETFKLTKRRDWARLYQIVALSLGGAAEYMTPAEFEVQFRKFSEQNPPLTHYFRVVYEALGDKCYESALAGASITAEKFPDNADVQREYRLLKELIARRTAGEGGGEGEGGAAEAAPAPTPEPGPAR